MKLDFTQVTYDGDLEEADSETLVELVQRFEDAQEDNAAEFEAAKEKLEDLEGTVSEYDSVEQDLTEAVVEETFLDEDEAAQLSFTRKREILAEAKEAEDETDTSAEGEFDDFGTEGEVSGDGEGDSTDSDVAQYLDGMSGIVLDN